MTTRSGGVQSVERAFHVLELIAAAGGEATISELSAAADLPLPTIHRFLRTMVGLGYVRQSPDRRYTLGARLVPLGEAANRRLGAVGRPVLQRIAEELGESANMATLDGQTIVYVGQVQSTRSMRMFTEVGRRALAHATGVGKAILATMPDDEVERVVGRQIDRPTERASATLEELVERLDVVRAQGYSVDDEEQEIGVRCYAVAVPGDHVRCGISVSGPTSRVDDAFGRRAVPLLHDAAEQLARALSPELTGAVH
ncbi:IclR family transcriptional regulator [Georgenia sp. Z1491]|uniref:IclR family transcriptional regulator n=1 Tax=Georgenia sp. Z1491 TaxID=3416707 RepID=UPI003CF5AF40